uniref:5'-deoxynucleotidase HDDC2 n=2 Tax=Zeugodacus cucurbitae TaxID=28588 RepID=A0A0A1X749_ZEUCU
MLSIQQVIKALRKLQNSSTKFVGGELIRQNFNRIVAETSVNATKSENVMNALGAIPPPTESAFALATTLVTSPPQSLTDEMISPKQQLQPHQIESKQQLFLATISSQTQQPQTYQQQPLRHSQVHEVKCGTSVERSVSVDLPAIENGGGTAGAENQIDVHSFKTTTTTTNAHASNYRKAIVTSTVTRSQQIHKFYQQHLHHFHTQNNQSLENKQTQYNAMSSLAAEPKTLKQEEQTAATTNGQYTPEDGNTSNGSSCNGNEQKNSSDKPCFNAGLGQILQFMELIGNLKHTKRTGWVLRNVSDPESISGHMYRMSMMTFLLDGSEGLNQIRCMELALVHDLAESVVGDLTPFCGVSKADKRAMEFKAMEDICKLIEPRGKRIMELFEEYEAGESAESKFVKDLDRLDMIMQAFEYEKRDNCLLKHQEFFDSTEGKFNHPFIKKLVDEIYVQRQNLARAEGATPPPPVQVPDIETLPSTNGQHKSADAVVTPAVASPKSETSTSS